MFARSRQQNASAVMDTQSFINAVFKPRDLVELRLIETWERDQKSFSKLVDRQWIAASELSTIRRKLLDSNRRGANIFFGVNPRDGQGGTKEFISRCNALWADLDDASSDDETRWSMLPPPTMIVNSGRGVHLYWRLKSPYLFQRSADRESLEHLLAGMYAVSKSDSVQDVTRLLRLPGYDNVKNVRNGASPRPCRIVLHRPEAIHAIGDFESFRPASMQSRPSQQASSRFEETQLQSCCKRVRRIRGLINLLDTETDDRSTRDFFVVTRLLRLGCDPLEVAQLVSEHSKFLGNESYLKRTIDNAVRVTSRLN